jgi:hypothetical protein
MGRSKEIGKPIAELTPDELQRERSRCQNLIKAFGDSPASHGLRKRLAAIESRIAREQKRAD